MTSSRVHQILSIQPSSSPSGVRRRRSDAEAAQQIDVLVAAQRSDLKYIKASTLKRRIEASARTIEQQADVHIARVYYNVCRKDSCTSSNEECVTVVSLDGDTPVTIVTDRESFVSVKHQLTRKCVCRGGEFRTFALVAFSFRAEDFCG